MAVHEGGKSSGHHKKILEPLRMLQKQWCSLADSVKLMDLRQVD
jgi:hypothetical protein